MCLEAQDRTHNKIEAGICNVCVGNDSLTKLLSCTAPELAVLPINDGLARVDLPCVDDIFRQSRGIDVKDRSSSTLSGIATIYSPSSDRGNSTVFTAAAASLSQARCQDATEGCIACAGPFLRSDVHFQRGGSIDWKIEHGGHFDDQFSMRPTKVS